MILEKVVRNGEKKFNSVTKNNGVIIFPRPKNSNKNMYTFT